MVRPFTRHAVLRALMSAVTFAAALSLEAAGSAQADVAYDAPAYTAHESQGYLTLTIHRADASGVEHVGFGVRKADGLPGINYDLVPKTYVVMAPGQSTYSFQMRIYDRDERSQPVHAVAYLYGAYPEPLSASTNTPITILRDDPLDTRNPGNPLGLSPAPRHGNVQSGARFYIAGAGSLAGQAEAQYARTNPAWAQALAVIANHPTMRRFWFWNEPNPTSIVADYLESTQLAQPGSTVELTTYSLVHGPCRRSDPPSFVQHFHDWIDRLAQGIGNYHVILYFEEDALITSDCLSPHGLHVRMVDELRWAIHRLEQDPHLVVYVDGGAADAMSWQRTARRLNEAGVHQAQGFFLNSTHFDWTTRELYYGQRIARRLHGVHFVINTGGNGRGPLATADPVHQGNEVLCNPPGRGLGPISTHTGYRWADAFSWFGTPGLSGGACRPGAPPDSVYWPAYGVMLVRNAVYRVTGPRYPLIRQR